MAEKEGEQYDWSAFYDDEGRLFYYNSKTDDSSWDPPEEGFNPPPQQPQAENDVSTEWIVYRDDEGREYYYNTRTEETQWEKPEGFTEGLRSEETSTDEEVLTKREEQAISNEGVDEENENVAFIKENTYDSGEEGYESGQKMEIDQEAQKEIDPAEKRALEAAAALNQPDSIMEPNVIANVTDVVSHEGGNPQKAITALIDNFVGQTAICALLGRWLAELRTATSGANSYNEQPSEATANEIRDIVQDVINKLAKERFSKDKADTILDLSKSEATFLQEMIKSPRWRNLLIDLTAEHKDSAVLLYCLRAISKLGHHREIARRINQSDHFSVFNAMLLSELSAIGKLAVSAGSESSSNEGIEEIVADLRRACTATSYTYLYTLELLRRLEIKANEELNSNSLMRFPRAIRKWEMVSQTLESAMIDPNESTSVAGSSPLFRKRRLDVALAVSKVQERQRRRLESNGGGDYASSNKNGNNIEAALFNLLGRHAMGIQVDDAILDPLLPSNFAIDGARLVGTLLLKHPVAIQALLSPLYRPGTLRATSTVVKNKCARLIAQAAVEAEKMAMREVDQSDNDIESDEILLTRMLLEGSQICEQLELMASFLVSDDAESKPGVSPGEKLCALAFKYSIVAQGVILWVKECTEGPDFPTSASYATISASFLSLVRLLAKKQPFTRHQALSIGISFLRHSNSDVSHTKVNEIREQSLRMILSLIVEGDAIIVFNAMKKLVESQGNGGLEPSLVRYFVDGVLKIVQPPLSLPFIRSFGSFLKSSKVVGAIHTEYFEKDSSEKLHKLLGIMKELTIDDKVILNDQDLSLVSSLISVYPH